MKATKRFAIVLFLVLPGLCAAETWKDVSLVDVNCSTKAKANADAHTRQCALQCSRSGYGIVTADGDFLKLDAKGNAEAVNLLKNSKKENHLRVTVNGEREGDAIKVQSLQM